MKQIIQKVLYEGKKLLQYYSHLQFLHQCISLGIAPKGLIPKMPIHAVPPSIRKSIDSLKYTYALHTTNTLFRQYYNLCLHHKNNLESLVEITLIAFPHLFTNVDNILTHFRSKIPHELYRLSIKLIKLNEFYQHHNISLPVNSYYMKENVMINLTAFESIFLLPPPPPLPSKPVQDQDTCKTICNLSHYKLSPIEITVLNRGLSFCPTKQIKKNNLIKDFLDFGRKLRWKYYWQKHPNNTHNVDIHSALQPFKMPSQNEPPSLLPNHPIEIYLNTILHKLTDDHFFNRLQSDKQNLNKTELNALNSLKNNKNIIILPADKGTTTVIQDYDSYINEGLRQLNDADFYEIAPNDPCSHVIDKIHNFTKRSGPDEGLTEMDIKMLVPPLPRIPNFYMLPKIHKQNHPGRPIVASYDSPTERISAFVDHHLQPIVSCQPSHIKDTKHFLEIIHNLDLTTHSKLFLVTIDVTSLYTNIPHDSGMQALKYFLDQRSSKQPSTNFLLTLANIVLSENYFTFNNEIYHQVKGTAMGTKMAPSYANIFMSHLESNFLLTQQQLPIIWKRFIDDIFLLWPHDKNSLLIFLNNLNQYSTLNFTYTISENTITFLDVDLTIIDGRITTSVHFKPTNHMQYLHFHSCHPSHIKQSIPYSLSLRGRRICNSPSNLSTYHTTIFSALTKRGYPKIFLNKHIFRRPQYQHHRSAQNTKTRDNDNNIRFITTYFDGSHKIRKLFQDFLPILQQNDDTKHLLTRPPSICYRQNPNFRNILSKTQSHPKNTLISPGTVPCNKARCKTCPIINQNIYIKTHHISTSYKAAPNTNCKTSHCVYILECQLCPCFYIGETKTPLNIRLNNHRHSCDSSPNNPLPIPTHARLHNQKFNECFTVRVLKSLPSSTTDVDLKTWELSYIWSLGAHYGQGLNRQH